MRLPRGRRLLLAGALPVAILLLGLPVLVIRQARPAPPTAQIVDVARTSVEFDGYGVSVPAGAGG